MSRGRVELLGGALVLLVAIGVFASCSKDKGTNPGVAGELASPHISASGGTFVHIFAHAGSFPYHCSIHNSMTGTVVADTAAATPMTAAVTIVGSAPYASFSPGLVTVKVGGTVTWTNNDGVGSAHTVTSD
jgi:plastocyanin